jgi:SAM-dependent methyltransferase
MGSYLGKYAEFYNVIYANKPYAQEAEFVHASLQRHAHGPVQQLLELACGTGRHAAALAALGYSILATDYSADLLSVARANATAANVQFELQDMRALKLDGRQWDAVYCLFDSIGYVQTNAAVQQVLQNIHTALRPDGLCILEFWHAPAMLRGYEPHRQASWPLPGGGQLERSSDTRLDIERQVAEVHYTLRELAADGSLVTELEETQVNRYFLVQEMALFLESAGLTPLEWLAAYTPAPITLDTWHVMVVARKAA